MKVIVLFSLFFVLCSFREVFFCTGPLVQSIFSSNCICGNVIVPRFPKTSHFRYFFFHVQHRFPYNTSQSSKILKNRFKNTLSFCGIRIIFLEHIFRHFANKLCFPPEISTGIFFCSLLSHLLKF